jgi:drug/metabolite transporter (DMT)-like permease
VSFLFAAMRFRVSRLDAWLLLMAFFWGSNFVVVKAALRELPGPVFNAIRLTIASALFLGVIAWREGLAASLARVPRGDWWRLVGLALLGHFVYQILFLAGVARTSVANSALIFACTPITVSLISAWLGHERPGWLRWTGTVVSLAGIYFVVGHGAGEGTSSLTGDGIIFLAMLSWAAYTVATHGMLDRYTPLFVTGITMALGTLPYIPVGLYWLPSGGVSGISLAGWAGILYSAMFSLVAAYVIWYTAVRELGSSHTAIYQNVVPIVAMAVATVFLREPLTGVKIGGAIAVLFGVVLTRLESAEAEPAEG